MYLYHKSNIIPIIVSSVELNLMTQTTITNLELIQPLANHQTLTDEQFMLLRETTIFMNM